jgi:hypothetical protein
MKTLGFTSLAVLLSLAATFLATWHFFWLSFALAAFLFYPKAAALQSFYLGASIWGLIALYIEWKTRSVLGSPIAQLLGLPPQGIWAVLICAICGGFIAFAGGWFGKQGRLYAFPPPQKRFNPHHQPIHRRVHK